MITAEILSDTQNYLTIATGEKTKRILDIESLMRKHAPGEVIFFLQNYLREKQKALKNLIIIDKTQHRVDETVGAIFRLYMAISLLKEAINPIENRKEVKNIVRFKQRTGKSGKLSHRNCVSNRSSRIRQDPHYDGENREIGYGA